MADPNTDRPPCLSAALGANTLHPMNKTRHAGGCLCGAIRYEAEGEPNLAGYCFCGDCRKASGSGFIPFMGFSRNALTFSGQTRMHRSPAASGRESVRNFCPTCGGLVFGGEVGVSESFTIYAGSLDDASAFHPTIGIFARDRPAWVVPPPGLKMFDGLPG
jgi:hypothetical protein